MKKYEIWKDNTKFIPPGKRLSKVDVLHCQMLHHRYETRDRARHILKTMRNQGIPCVIRQR